MMLSRESVKSYFEELIKEDKIELPKDISVDDIAELFCIYLETDYYDWLKSNFNSFVKQNDDWFKYKLNRAKEDGIFLTAEQREKLRDWYANNIYENIEWHDEKVIFSICQEGVHYASDMSDEELIEYYLNEKEIEEFKEIDWDNL